jgi:hypothetical protein
MLEVWIALPFVTPSSSPTYLIHVLCISPLERTAPLFRELVPPRHNLRFTSSLCTAWELRARPYEDIRKGLCHAQRIRCRVERKISLSVSVVIVKPSLNYSFLAAGTAVFMPSLPSMICLYDWTFVHNAQVFMSDQLKFTSKYLRNKS